ncbi:transmembrane amino acid transporter [Micractinium conductrix]|uniref:Transmembrane amino acid transporter n=1 Tax=Micractinium conductrix TaxID=554055 RepID=A0A2P6VNJ8_9CHLO|nr:transmembrane amino acid transporter [Micractinium conductrix]|eukprot:PSC75625.1 transmembrane amino acid transporter [Micractinium conductrix]
MDPADKAAQFVVGGTEDSGKPDDVEAPVPRKGFLGLMPSRKKTQRQGTMLDVHELEEQRHGTWVQAFFHVITAVIGSGVLYLPFFFSVLGWVGGIIMTLTFGFITWYTSRLLADAMVVDGVRYRTYQSAVEACFGKRGGIILAIVQYPNLVLTAVAYNITAANSMKSFAFTYKSFTSSPLCTLVDEETGYCIESKYWVFSVIFGAFQLFMSQMPNLDSAAWASFIGAVMSFGYSFLSLGMSIYQLVTYGGSPTRVDGYPVEKIGHAQLTWDVFNAFGGIVFAFSFSFILIEISDTIKDGGKGPVWHMKRAVWVAVATITGFYILVSCLGYAAYGYEALYNNAYVIDFWAENNGVWDSSPATTNVARAANIMVLIHMVPAYQVFSQPVFAAVERSLRHKHSWMLGTKRRWTFRLVWRSIYVVLVCFVAIALPFFSDFVGLIGALGFWPATVLFPIEMYRKIHKPSMKETIWLEALNLFCLLITICAVMGSIQLLVKNASGYSFF